jgi:hypothetical protein
MGGWGLTHPSPVQGLPPSEDLPEEVLRTEIITEARSPIDGTLLTAAEYAELQAKLRSTAAVKPDIAPQIQTRIILLRIRKIFRSIVPFIP